LGEEENMDVFHNLFLGFSSIFQPENLFFCFIGVFIGTLIGVLPGIGPVGAMSLLLPATYKVTPLGSLIMLSGIYYGAQYGGSTTSILVNIPGESSSVVTCLDGYQMARQGRAGPALGMAAFASFIAGTLSLFGLMFIAPPLASMALRFGPPEYFSLMCLGLTILIYLASGSVLRAIMMATAGVLFGCAGQDPETGSARFVFGIPDLLDGIGLAPFVMGLFGVSEVFLNIEQTLGSKEVFSTKIKGLLPNWQDWRNSISPILRGSVIGFFLGILPGGGAVISSFSSYAIEKKLSRHPEHFGKGAIEGVAGPESANNAASEGAFIPLLTLGIPPNVVMALLLGALMVHGITPGPLLIPKHPEIFWGVIASMYLGNAMLLVLNLPLIGIWVQILKVPYKILFPLILLFCLIGAYSINNSTFDVGAMLVFGVVGYLMRKYKFEGAPMVLAFVLGPMLESSLRQSLLLSNGSFSIFFMRPIAAGGMIATFLMLLSCIIPVLRKKREAIPMEETT
jgi:putative tricarboxylic transport membrane protein